MPPEGGLHGFSNCLFDGNHYAASLFSLTNDNTLGSVVLWRINVCLSDISCCNDALVFT
jgi:hypothetical protein